MMGKRCSRAAFFYFPLPRITKLKRFLCNWDLFKTCANPDRNKDEKTKQEYEEKKNECMEEIEKYDRIMVLSLVIESSLPVLYADNLRTPHPDTGLHRKPGVLRLGGPLQPEDSVHPLLIRVLRNGILCHQVYLKTKTSFDVFSGTFSF